jgi:hypothetical protein
MAIKVYQGGEAVRIESRGNQYRPINLIFKQYYSNGASLSWKSFSFPSVSELQACISSNEKKTVFRSAILAGSFKEKTGLGLKLQAVVEHLAQEAAEKAVKKCIVKACTLSVMGVGDDTEYEFSALNALHVNAVFLKSCALHLQPGAEKEPDQQEGPKR